MEDNKNITIIMIVIIFVLLAGLAFILYVTGRNTNKTSQQEDLLNIDYGKEGNEMSLEQYTTKNPIVAMHIKNYGSIVMELYPNIAENTVNNFISLVKSGFYDNNTMHRLIPGFVLQGGDPTGTGTGGPGYNIKGEFTANGYKNELKHTKGVISMARSQAYDSAGSQFFIMLGTSTNLDGQYASFGKIIDGWDNIERIVKEEKIANQESGKLKTNLIIEKAIVDLKGMNYKEVKKITK